MPDDLMKCPGCGLPIAFRQYGGKGVKPTGPWLYCNECGYDGEAEAMAEANGGYANVLPAQAETSAGSEWWTKTPPEAASLAKRLASRRSDNLEAMVCAFESCPTMITPDGPVAFVNEWTLMPFWACFVGIAQGALDMRDAMDVEKAVPSAQGGEAVDFTEEGPDAQWRKETGLDGE